MAVARRRFVGLLARIAAVLVVPVASLAAPARYVEAIRGRFDRVPFKPLRPSEISKPGRWKG